MRKKINISLHSRKYCSPSMCDSSLKNRQKFILIGGINVWKNFCTGAKTGYQNTKICIFWYQYLFFWTCQNSGKSSTDSLRAFCLLFFKNLAQRRSFIVGNGIFYSPCLNNLEGNFVI